jgi:hypothetical protein
MNKPVRREGFQDPAVPIADDDDDDTNDNKVTTIARGDGAATASEPELESNDDVAEALPKADDAPEPDFDIPEEVWPITIRLLHKQIKNNRGELVTELNFREPTAGDISRAGGNPCRLDNELNILIDDRKMMTLMANLCGIMEPRLARMDPRDYNSCAYRLRNFFIPEARAWM